MFLTETEIKELTHRQRRPAQIKALRSMGVEHRQRPDGSIAILKKHVESVFTGFSKTNHEDEAEINWDAEIPARKGK